MIDGAKKLSVLAFTMAVICLVDLDQARLDAIITISSAFLIGQGIADVRKGGRKL